MPKSLNFDTGRVEYDINGAATVSFNPTDTAFVERVHKLFTDLESRQDEYQKRIEEIGEDGAAMFAYASERDQEMRGLIDGVLGEGVADALFPDMNCYALAAGMPVWVNLMFAIAEEIDAAFGEQQKKADPRLKKYNAKFEAMRKKYRRK